MSFRQFRAACALVCCSALLPAQPVTKGCIADLNCDGSIDTLAFYDDPAPCDFKYLVTFTDGKTGDKASVPREEYCKCQIRSLVPVPPVFWRPENADVLALIKAGLLPEEHATPDPSFAWILRGLDNHRRLKKHPYFELVIDPGLERLPGKVAPPGTYSLPVSGNTFECLLAGNYYAEVTAAKGFVIYYGHNHYQRRDQRSDSITLIANTKASEIYRTSHGLFAQTATDHQWLFVTDSELTGAPDKLRWASIGDVAVWEDRLLILQHRKPVSGGTAVFLIDLASGRTVQLRHNPLGAPDDHVTFSVKGNSLGLKTSAPGDPEREALNLVLSLETLWEELGLL